MAVEHGSESSSEDDWRKELLQVIKTEGGGRGGGEGESSKWTCTTARHRQHEHHQRYQELKPETANFDESDLKWRESHGQAVDVEKSGDLLDGPLTKLETGEGEGGAGATGDGRRATGDGRRATSTTSTPAPTPTPGESEKKTDDEDKEEEGKPGVADDDSASQASGRASGHHQQSINLGLGVTLNVNEEGAASAVGADHYESKGIGMASGAVEGDETLQVRAKGDSRAHRQPTHQTNQITPAARAPVPAYLLFPPPPNPRARLITPRAPSFPVLPTPPPGRRWRAMGWRAGRKRRV